jgi:Mn-dependent DtxR family transcriptional regulator
MSRKYSTRKDIAQLMEVSVRTVTNNEKRLGLDSCRRDINPRTIRYDSELAKEALRKNRAL